MPLLYSLLFLLTLLSVTAQPQTYFSGDTSNTTSKCGCLNPAVILGFWESIDTAKQKIEFIYDKTTFLLVTDSPYSSAYEFFPYSSADRDSIKFVSSQGVIIKWPPDHCNVKIRDEDTIEIEYADIGGVLMTRSYKRIKP